MFGGANGETRNKYITLIAAVISAVLSFIYIINTIRGWIYGSAIKHDIYVHHVSEIPIAQVTRSEPTEESFRRRRKH